MDPMAEKLLQVKDLKTYFFQDEGTVKAVDGVSFDIDRQQTLGVVGESGCGKSVTARSILRITGRRGQIVSGELLFHRRSGTVDLAQLDPMGEQIKQIRGREIAMIFQEPMTSFSPVYTIGNQIIEAILLHQDATPKEAREQAVSMLDRVGIPKPSQRVDEYPHQLSGGMRQRAMIAMALSCNPQLLIADEPTTALDVTIQAQILELMQDLQDDYDMAIMMITHNLGVIAEVAEEVVVMYLGRIVEKAPVVEVFHHPKHPYTRLLLQSIPKLGLKTGQQLASIKGTVPDASNVPPGCSFHPRCPEFLRGICNRVEPRLLEVEAGHEVSCVLYDEEVVGDGQSADNALGR